MHGEGSQETLTDLALLKYRARDELESVFSGYRRAAAATSAGAVDTEAAEADARESAAGETVKTTGFDMFTLRDHRLRGYYAERYDSRKALADYDYHYVFKDTCADIVHIKQYKEWRLTGCAFELGDHTYTEANCTMSTYAEGIMKKGRDKGLKKDVRGYWGDIVLSPYVTFGVDADTRIK